jgi:hypothetical protein
VAHGGSDGRKKQSGSGSGNGNGDGNAEVDAGGGEDPALGSVYGWGTCSRSMNAGADVHGNRMDDGKSGASRRPSPALAVSECPVPCALCHPPPPTRAHSNEVH